MLHFTDLLVENVAVSTEKLSLRQRRRAFHSFELGMGWLVVPLGKKEHG